MCYICRFCGKEIFAFDHKCEKYNETLWNAGKRKALKLKEKPKKNK